MRKARGFTLVEVLVVLIIFGIVLTMAAAVTRGLAAGQKRSNTVTRMQTVDAAIAQFVAVQKRMPCPADGTLASTANNAGVEANRDAAAGCTSETGGVVPWVTLGLTETDATDGWDHRFTYRIDPSLAIDARLDMSLCDPASTVGFGATPTCNPACTGSSLGSCTTPQSYLFGKGLQVKNLNNAIIMEPSPATPATTPATGAAYVVISAGETGGGAYLNSGNIGTTTSTQDGNAEKTNYADRPAQTTYVDDSISDVAGATHFDDLVSRPSVLTVINKAALGPRSHS